MTSAFHDFFDGLSGSMLVVGFGISLVFSTGAMVTVAGEGGRGVKSTLEDD